MDMNLETKMPERNYLCNFSIETRIDDTELSSKIKEKLCSLNLLPNAEMIYVIAVSFDADIYKDEEFYKFPIERKQWEIDKLKTQAPKERAQNIIGEVLSQQLNNITTELAPFNIRYQSASIAGEDFGDINRVDFCIYEDTASQKENTLSNKKKSRRKETRITAHSIIPHRPSMLKMAAKVFAEQIIRQAEAEYKKEEEKANHSPNMVCVDDIFVVLATAILEEQPKEFSSPELVSFEMIAHAQMKNDWPLEIVGEDGVFSEERELELGSEIDCPEYLIFIKRKHNWTLKKVEDLIAAKHTILFSGYNQKSVEQVIVLHNLKPVSFNLFIEDNGEIIPISKSEAHKAKKLLLSWNNE